MPSLKHQPGMVIGRLTLRKHLSKRGWICKCSCGKTVIVAGGNLTHTQSCGCYRKEATGDSFRKHGMAGTTEYNSWIAMKARCEKRDEYVGCKIDPTWIADFDRFISDMGKKPLGNDYVIERIDPKGGYNKDNCLWLPREENKPDSREGQLTVWGKAKQDTKTVGLLRQLQQLQRLPVCQTTPSEIPKLPALEQFLYWISQRHEIWVKRQLGFKKPWTTDPLLQSYFFTCPYRENDKVTVWFKENIREPLRNSSKVLMATIIFRWFNYPPTGNLLMGEGLHLNWDRKRAFKVLDAERKQGNKIFTGAFMINSPKGEGKLEAITRRITQVWEDKKRLEDFFTRQFREKRGDNPSWYPLSMQEAHKRLSTYEGHGKFMSYEVVCDLRYTFLLENAPDKLTWCNPGPGAVRGLLRILDRPFKRGDNSATPPLPSDWDEQLQKMLKLVQRRLKSMPPFEMREIEHSLCETDKYLRALNGTTEGRMKRRYKGV